MIFAEKKKYLAALLAVNMLAGCTKSAPQEVSRYEVYYRTIEENTRFVSSSENYSVSAEMTQWDDGTYRYYVIFDEPKISMYDIVIMTVEDERPYQEALKMMPSSGVFDASSSMIPNQVNSKAGFVKGLIVSGECEDDEIELSFLVEWKDKSRKDTYREFLRFTLNMEGIVREDVPADEVPAEEVPAEEIPAEEVPAEEVPVEEAPAAQEGAG